MYYATEWQDYPSDAQIENHVGPWLMQVAGFEKSLEVGWFEKIKRGDVEEWSWCNDSRKIRRNHTNRQMRFAPLVIKETESKNTNTVRAKCERVRLPTAFGADTEQVVWVRESDIRRIFEYVPGDGSRCVVSIKTDADEKGTYVVNATADVVVEACAIAYNAVRGDK